MTSKTALIVAQSDQVALIATAMLEALRCCNVNLLRVTTLAEAIVALQAERVDVVIVDVPLPNGKGIASSLTPILTVVGAVPVVAITSDPTEETKAAAIAAGAAKVFRKGQEWKAAEFGRTIATLVGVVT